MTIKLMTTRHHHCRSVDKRTVPILWLSNHAKKEITHLNQERCWGFGDAFLRHRGETQERSLLCFLLEVLLMIS